MVSEKPKTYYPMRRRDKWINPKDAAERKRVQKILIEHWRQQLGSRFHEFGPYVSPPKSAESATAIDSSALKQSFEMEDTQPPGPLKIERREIIKSLGESMGLFETEVKTGVDNLAFSEQDEDPIPIVTRIHSSQRLPQSQVAPKLSPLSPEPQTHVDHPFDADSPVLGPDTDPLSTPYTLDSTSLDAYVSDHVSASYEPFSDVEVSKSSAQPRRAASPWVIRTRDARWDPPFTTSKPEQVRSRSSSDNDWKDTSYKYDDHAAELVDAARGTIGSPENEYDNVGDLASESHLSFGLVLSEETWRDIRHSIREDWKRDLEYNTTHSNNDSSKGCWTCTPSEPDEPENFPLTISSAPVVIPIEHQWPPMAGVNPPPDPRPSTPISCTSELPIDVIRDIFLTFEGSLGFYILINGLMQILVPETFDKEWASSHFPHKFGGLKISYIDQNMEPTVTLFPSKTETVKTQESQTTQSSSSLNIFRPSLASIASSAQPLRINDFIEAKVKSSYRKEKFAGRVGLKVINCGTP